MPSEPSRFVLSLPKADLHLHLEGSIEPSTLLELRQRHAMEGASLAEGEQLYNYKDFAGFLTAFKDVTGHLRTPEDYELITYRLMERLKSQNVLHAEVIVSVGVCLWRKQDFAAIFEGLDGGGQRGEKDFSVSLLQSGSRAPMRAARSTVFISRRTRARVQGPNPSGAR